MRSIQFPEYLRNMVDNTKETVCDLLQDPTVWSEHMIKETMNRTGGEAFDINDVELIIRNYLDVLTEKIQTGKDFK